MLVWLGGAGGYQNTGGARSGLLVCAGMCSGGVLWEYTESTVRGCYDRRVLGCVGLLLKYTGVFMEGCSADCVGR